MIEILKFEGKTEEEVLKNIEVNDYHYTVEEQKAGLLKGKKYVLTAISKDEVKKYIKNFISSLAQAMNIKVSTEIRFNEDYYSVMLISESNPILIGKEGRTLNSIQLLLHQTLSNLTNFNIRITVDAAGYKQNKEKRLESVARRVCKEVLNTKVEAKLDPMNSYERRIIHNTVGKFDKLKSESYGEEPQRYVVISYKED
jgi:spoIIIJ-associated protein